jgi:hypothetical protein
MRNLVWRAGRKTTQATSANPFDYLKEFSRGCQPAAKSTLIKEFAADKRIRNTIFRGGKGKYSIFQ